MQASEKLAIAELLNRAAFALDAKDLAVLEATFTEDARFTLLIDGVEEPSVFEGRDAIMTLFSDALEAQTDVRRHVISNVFYNAEGSSAAEVVSYLSLFGTENGTTRLITCGVYTDTVVGSSDGWRIQARHLHLDTPY